MTNSVKEHVRAAEIVATQNLPHNGNIFSADTSFSRFVPTLISRGHDLERKVFRSRVRGKRDLCRHLYIWGPFKISERLSHALFLFFGITKFGMTGISVQVCRL